MLLHASRNQPNKFRWWEFSWVVVTLWSSVEGEQNKEKEEILTFDSLSKPWDAPSPQKWLHLWPKSEKNNVLAERGEAIYFCDMQLNTRHVSHWSKHVIGKISRQRDQVWAINKRFVQIKDVANMSGKVMGVQAQKLKEYPLATSSPCASHTLWLMQLTYALRFQHCLVL